MMPIAVARCPSACLTVPAEFPRSRSCGHPAELSGSVVVSPESPKGLPFRSRVMRRIPARIRNDGVRPVRSLAGARGKRAPARSVVRRTSGRWSVFRGRTSHLRLASCATKRRPFDAQRTRREANPVRSRSQAQRRSGQRSGPDGAGASQTRRARVPRGGGRDTKRRYRGIESAPPRLSSAERDRPGARTVQKRSSAITCANAALPGARTATRSVSGGDVPVGRGSSSPVAVLVARCSCASSTWYSVRQALPREALVGRLRSTR